MTRSSPGTSDVAKWNADDWHLFLSQSLDSRANFPNGLATVALMIAESMEAMRAPAQTPADLRDVEEENRKLRERLGPRGLEVVMIDGAGHYVNEKVKAEIERLRDVPQASGMPEALEQARKALEPFALNPGAISLSKALGHISREHLLAARDAVQALGAPHPQCSEDIRQAAIICEAKYGDFEEDVTRPERAMKMLVESLALLARVDRALRKSASTCSDSTSIGDALRRVADDLRCP